MQRRRRRRKQSGEKPVVAVVVGSHERALGLDLYEKECMMSKENVHLRARHCKKEFWVFVRCIFGRFAVCSSIESNEHIHLLATLSKVGCVYSVASACAFNLPCPCSRRAAASLLSQLLESLEVQLRQAFGFPGLRTHARIPIVGKPQPFGASFS
jgi:hypothetical protein